MTYPLLKFSRARTTQKSKPNTIARMHAFRLYHTLSANLQVQSLDYSIDSEETWRAFKFVILLGMSWQFEVIELQINTTSRAACQVSCVQLTHAPCGGGT